MEIGYSDTIVINIPMYGILNCPTFMIKKDTNLNLCSTIVLCGNILMSLFIYIILILSSRKVRHLLVVYNDLKVNNIMLSALEYSLTLLWYKSNYLLVYKYLHLYSSLYSGS